jgi:hypothetical protein
MDEATLRTVWQQRQQAPTWVSLSSPLATLVGKTLAKRVKQLSAIAQIWDEIIPAEFHDHTALESLHRGTLTVCVDSASRRFQLQRLFNGGLLKDIQARCPQPIQKVRLVLGSLGQYDAETDQHRYTFQA